MDQPLAQGTGVELLEDILIVQILEYGYTAGKFVIDFSFRDSFAGLLEQGVTISDKTVSLEMTKDTLMLMLFTWPTTPDSCSLFLVLCG